MPERIYARSNTRGFHGLSSIFQYVNADGQNPGTACGQAACATLLTYCAGRPANISTLRDIERTHPADIRGGQWGTSPSQIEACLTHYGARSTSHIETEDSLKRSLRSSFPVICIIQNSGGLFGLGDGAHWFVPFAYNDDGIFVTNYGSNPFLTWAQWREKWNSPLSQSARVLYFRGITSTSRVLSDNTVPSNVA